MPLKLGRLLARAGALAALTLPLALLATPAQAQRSQAVTWDVVPPARGVAQVQLGGQYVLLNDGSRWEVSPEDRPTAAAWLEEETITIRLIGAPTVPYEYLLINADQDRTAAARFAGRGRPLPAEGEDPPNRSQGVDRE